MRREVRPSSYYTDTTRIEVRVHETAGNADDATIRLTHYPECQVVGGGM